MSGAPRLLQGRPAVVGLIAWEPEVAGAPPEGVLLRVVHAVAGHREVVARLDLREERVPCRTYAGQRKALGEDPVTVPPAPRAVARLCDALVNQAAAWLTEVPRAVLAVAVAGHQALHGGRVQDHSCAAHGLQPRTYYRALLPLLLHGPVPCNVADVGG